MYFVLMYRTNRISRVSTIKKKFEGNVIYRFINSAYACKIPSLSRLYEILGVFRLVMHSVRRQYAVIVFLRDRVPPNLCCSPVNSGGKQDIDRTDQTERSVLFYAAARTLRSNGDLYSDTTNGS